MDIEIIGGVKTVFHSGKATTLKNIASLLVKFMFENSKKQEEELSCFQSENGLMKKSEQPEMEVKA